MLYLDIFSGLSGDMFLGAMIDLGVPLARLEAELRALGIGGYQLQARRASKSGIEGVKFEVLLDDGTPADHATHSSQPHSHPHSHSHSRAHSHSHGHADSPDHDPSQGGGHEHGRTYADIRDLILRSSLGSWVKARAIAVFDRIAQAEGKIHGHPPEQVHFNEVGAMDSIVDVVGACVALDLLGQPEVMAGPVMEGTGFVRCAHGRMPLPAPATLEIFAARGVPISQCEEPSELITPTGAALLAEFATHFGPLAGFRPSKIGYGLGTRDNRTRPNVVRALLGERTDTNPLPSLTPVAREQSGLSEGEWETDTIAVLETNLDDVSGEVLGHMMDRAFAAGALDVFHTPIQMKKNRPGVLFTILCDVEAAEGFSRMLLTGTSAFGVRQTLAGRRKLRREFHVVKTEFGEVTVKTGYLGARRVQAAPEFESCREVAAAAGVELLAVYQAALKAV